MFVSYFSVVFCIYISDSDFNFLGVGVESITQNDTEVQFQTEIFREPPASSFVKGKR